MMMASDSRRDRPELSAESLAALGVALQAYFDDADLDALQPALTRIASEAREQHMHAEELLVALKDVWFALPQVARAARDEQNRALQRVVTLCVRAYYG